MEFAVIHTGGKQYKVAVGDTVSIEKLGGDFAFGDKVVFDKVIMHDTGKDTKIGAPYLAGVKVEALFQETGKGKKVVVQKYKAKSRYLKRNGHRQPFTKVKISAIA